MRLLVSQPRCLLKLASNQSKSVVNRCYSKNVIKGSSNHLLLPRNYSSSDDGSVFLKARSLFGVGGQSKQDSSLHKVYAEHRLLGFSMEQMFDVVMDVGAYEKFLPWCQSSRVLSRRKDYITAELAVGLPPLTETYTSVVNFDKPHRIHADAKQGRLFSELVNHWEFHPGLRSHPTNSCIVKFHVAFTFKSAITAKLGNVFFDDTAKAMTSAFYDEAKRRYGKESIPPMKIQIVPKDSAGSGGQGSRNG